MVTYPDERGLAMMLAQRLGLVGAVEDRVSIGFGDFKKRVYRGYMSSPHIEMLDDHLMGVMQHVATGGQEGIGFLVVEMPPRHSKTLNVSKLFPPYALGHLPDSRIINVSYGQGLANKNSRYARNLIKRDVYAGIFPGVRLADDSSSVASWDLDGREGGLDALGIGGGATGKGAHFLLIDDPIKSRAEAESQVYRDKVWDSFTDDLLTRLEPGGAVVVQHTRWQEDDLIGRIVRSGIEHVRLRLPAIAEEGDPLGRAVGEALWPDRYPLAKLREIEATMGPYSWSALYQQAPTPAEGGIFKRDWFEAVSEPVQIVRMVRYWDLAMSSKESADYTAGVKLGEGKDGNIYVLDVARVQMEWGDVVPFMQRVIQQDGEDCMQGIEKQGYMSRAVQDLNRDPALRRYTIKGYAVDKDKLTRALPFAARAAAGVVRVLKRVWTRDYVQEMASFPNGAHDDQVDATAGAWAMLGTKRGISVETTRWA